MTVITSVEMADQIPLLRPTPRRTFELTPASTESSAPATPSPETTDPNHLDPKTNGNAPPSRTRSILNLTSSTLFGIYSRSPYDTSREEASTPWGTGAQTPSQRPSIDESRPLVAASLQTSQPRRLPSQHHPGFQNHFLPLALRTLLLFAFGLAYGVIITHLHDDQRLAPVKVVGIKRYSWAYLIFWGVAGVGLGSLLPWVDVLWEQTLGTEEGIGANRTLKEDSRSSGTSSEEDERPSSRSGSGMGADWNPVVRSIGAFVGIAFAIVGLHCPLYEPTNMSPRSGNCRGNLRSRSPSHLHSSILCYGTSSIARSLASSFQLSLALPVPQYCSVSIQRWYLLLQRLRREQALRMHHTIAWALKG